MEEKGAKGLSVEDFEDYLNERVAYWSKRSPAADDSVAWVEAELEPLVPK